MQVGIKLFIIMSKLIKECVIAALKVGGDMILAKNRKYDTKIKAYTESIQHLQNALKEKIDITQDRDRVVDLQDLIYNVEILKNYTDKIFKKKKSRKSSRKSSK